MLLLDQEKGPSFLGGNSSTRTWNRFVEEKKNRRIAKERILEPREKKTSTSNWRVEKAEGTRTREPRDGRRPEPPRRTRDGHMANAKMRDWDTIHLIHDILPQILAVVPQCSTASSW
mmetsp:Transcript_10053/g.20776  ORF Transcript_10053/g.20776 Transcript_10053/m.20776 type:complete len:117 (-) Transcript_10053:89-439(-)